MQSKQRKECISSLAAAPLFTSCSRSRRVKVFWYLLSSTLIVPLCVLYVLFMKKHYKEVQL